MSFPFERLPAKDLYQELHSLSRPIVIYGMGDGAAKLMYVLTQKGIGINGVCASDDFVRGQSFMGYPVQTCQQAAQALEDPVFLLAFASRRPEVIAYVQRFSQDHRVYIPDVNVYGKIEEVFDNTYLSEHKRDIQALYESLADEDSREFMFNLICYKLSGDMAYLWQLDKSRKDPRSYIGNVYSYCDLGAYNGDSLLEWKTLHPEMRFALAVEPNPSQFKKLQLTDISIDKICVNAAVSDHDSEQLFGVEKGRGASMCGESLVPGMRRPKTKPVRTATLDTLIAEHNVTCLDLIKFDVEGFEQQAIQGARDVIKTMRPSLVVSAYHQNKDLLGLWKTCADLLGPCKIYLSRPKVCFPAWETEFTIIPEFA